MTIKTRLARLEAAQAGAAQTLMGSIEVPRGVRPIDALAGASPGLWLLVDQFCDWGALGRVTPGGRRTVVYGEGWSGPPV